MSSLAAATLLLYCLIRLRHPIYVKRIGEARIEWALLVLIGVVCLGFSVLQYRWTGEVSRAERLRLRSGLDDQVHRLSRAFDNEIGESCSALVPPAVELSDEGIATAHASRYRQWASTHDRGLFTRIGVAVPKKGVLRLYSFDGEGSLTPIEWPLKWKALGAEMAARAQGSGPAPSVTPESTLIEVPVFSDSHHGRGPAPELEWMIFEVDEEHLRAKTLPQLVQEYLNSGGDAAYDASVSWADPHRPVIYSTRTDHSSVAAGADAIKAIFPLHMPQSQGRGRGRFREQDAQARWVLAVRHQEGSLDAAVSRTRLLNFAISLVLTVLLGGTGWALVRYTARSRRLAQMQFRFAVGVSHDLRTPLTAIRGAAFNLDRGVITEPAAVGRYAKLILRNAEQLTSMVEDVLAFSASLQSGRHEKRETFSPADLLQHAATAMAEEVEQAGCRIEVGIAPDLPQLTGDPIALEHAFRNLIANAARHAAEGGWIGISAAYNGGGVEVRICDRGPGIPQAEHERIFQPFYRGEHTVAAQVSGTGLGLSIVKDTVERHQGTVSVANASEGGAQFTVRLPVIREST